MKTKKEKEGKKQGKALDVSNKKVVPPKEWEDKWEGVEVVESVTKEGLVEMEKRLGKKFREIANGLEGVHATIEDFVKWLKEQAEAEDHSHPGTDVKEQSTPPPSK